MAKDVRGPVRQETFTRVLMEALPYIQSFYDRTIVLKYGGSTMTDPDLKDAFIKDVVLMHYVGIRLVVVHGGGPEITRMMRRLGKEAHFIDGLRVTDRETVDITEMVLKGKVLQEIVASINRAGGQAVGLSGKDGNLFTARKLMAERPGSEGDLLDIGFVGEIDSVNADILGTLDSRKFIPVISPLGVGPDGHTYNINADSVAGSIAGALGATKLIMLTDTPGILRNESNPSSLISHLTLFELRDLVAEKAISGGMIPKVKACETALQSGVEKAHIIDGRIPHSLLLEIFTDHGVGTEVVAN